MELVLGNQGAMCDGAMTGWDHDTESVWSQPLGTAIAGERKGATLPLVPSTLTTWQAWRKRHPNTRGLRAHMATSARRRLRDLAIVVRVLDEAAAYPVSRVWEEGVINDVVGGIPIGVVGDPADRAHWKVFCRQVDGHPVTLRVQGNEVIDFETQSSWDPVTREALSGPGVGNAVTEVAAFAALPEDFARLWPEGVLHGRLGASSSPPAPGSPHDLDTGNGVPLGDPGSARPGGRDRSTTDCTTDRRPSTSMGG